MNLLYKCCCISVVKGKKIPCFIGCIEHYISTNYTFMVGLIDKNDHFDWKEATPKLLLDVHGSSFESLFLELCCDQWNQCVLGRGQCWTEWLLQNRNNNDFTWEGQILLGIQSRETRYCGGHSLYPWNKSFAWVEQIEMKMPTRLVITLYHNWWSNYYYYYCCFLIILIDATFLPEFRIKELLISFFFWEMSVWRLLMLLAG